MDPARGQAWQHGARKLCEALVTYSLSLLASSQWRSTVLQGADGQRSEGQNNGRSGAMARNFGRCAANSSIYPVTMTRNDTESLNGGVALNLNEG